MKNTCLHELSEKELLAALARADARCDAIIDEMIAVGRGHELPSETVSKTDDLSRRDNAARWARMELQDQKRERMTYHGSLKPIKRKF